MTYKVVHKIEPGMNRQEVMATTYQMRNFYRQLGDGFFSTLDVMNYIQHHQIVKWCKPGNHVLDVCCGRGLILPLLRYQVKKLGSYTGVDIEPRNATWRSGRVTNGQPIERGYYPFPTKFVESNVADMANKLLPQKFEVIIYTSAIEHMHKEMGQASLHECRKVSRLGTIMVLTCPNTPEGQDGFNTQYAAHIYEWKRSELLEGLQQAGFEVVTEWGLLINKKSLKTEAERLGLLPFVDRVEKFIPTEWLCPVLAPMFPRASKEIGFLCKAV